MKLPCIGVIVALSSSAFADTTLRLGTDVAVFSKTTTEAECVAKAKAALTAAGLTPTAVDHGIAATRMNLSVVVDCLQSWKANAAHISTAGTATEVDNAPKVRAAIKTALEAAK